MYRIIYRLEKQKLCYNLYRILIKNTHANIMNKYTKMNTFKFIIYKFSF